MGVFLLILAGIALLLELVSLYRPKQLLYMSSRPLVKVTEPDREFQMETVVENRGRMPILFARLIEYLPYKGSRSQKVTSNLYLMPRERVTRRRTLTLSQRGRYFFHGGVLEIGDFLGLTQSQRAFFQTEEVVVLPKPLDKASLSKTMGGLMGDRSVQRFIWEDPMLTIGFNDYTGREPMKKISWTRTAQAGRLMVKTYDVTEDAVVSLVVNTDHGQRLSSDGLMMERLFSTARSIAEELEASGIRYRFITNMRQAGQDYQGSYIPAGAGQSQLFRVLTALGLYKPLIDFAGAGATVPLTGFGYNLARGVARGIAERGFLGILLGGVTAAAGGIAAAVFFGYLAALLFKAKPKP